MPCIDLALAAHQFLPEKYLVDTGSVDAEELVSSQQPYGVELFGPTRQDDHWQARQGTGFAACQVVVEWQQECATCPEGHPSQSWTPAQDRRGKPVITITFATQDCRSCPSREPCPQSQSTSPPRVLTMRPQPQDHALQAARHRQATERWH